MNNPVSGLLGSCQVAGRVAGLLAGLLAGACGDAADPTAVASTDAIAVATPAQLPASVPASLSGRLDCLRENAGAVVIAHRGGPTREYPENAMETLQRTLEAGASAMEVDIAQSKDGVLFLMHDDDLDRTSTGEGPLADRTWDEIKALDLETYQSKTAYHPPTLDQALDWAVANKVLLELNRKRSTPVEKVIAAVRARKAENNVFIITYTDDQAVELHQAAPDLVITASVDSIEKLGELLSRGVVAERLVAWTGMATPDPTLWKALADRGVESIFGTQNARDTQRDSDFWEDDDGSEYNGLVAGGLAFIVTGYSDKVSRQLSASDGVRKACGL